MDMIRMMQEMSELKQDTALLIKLASPTCFAYPKNVSYYLLNRVKTIPCDNEWLVVMRRVDNHHNFPTRSWHDYKVGFGSTSNSYWAGLETMHQITTHRPCKLMVTLVSWSDLKRYAAYSSFVIGDEADGYRLSVSGYTGTAGDSLSFHNNKKFTTMNRDNSGNIHYNCAGRLNTAWWHREDCGFSSVLIAKYGQNERYLNYWGAWKSPIESYKKIEMKIMLT
jgi:hypothetical protein